MAYGESSDISFQVNPLNANAENVGKWIQEHMADRTDPASSAPGMPPLYGQDAVPHTMTFQSLVGSFSRAYINPDEAIRDSVNNAHLMEKDVGLLESVECRQRLTALLDWEIIPEDQKCPYQVSLAQELQRIISRIKHFTKYRMWLMKAIWYGRSGIQHKYGYTRVNGAMRLMPTPLHQDHNGWMPVHGDKLVYRYEDSISSSHDEGAYPHQMGIRVGTNMGRDARIHREYKLEPVSDGLALFLKPYERDTFCVHKHFIEDAAFHHSYFSGSIHGVGIRSKIYWEWFLKQEAFAFLMQYLERSAGGIEVWTYPMGDDKALKATQEAAREKMANGRNVIFFPKPLGDDSDAYKFEIIEPGAMGLDIMQSIIENYFGGRLKRYILGQELSTEAKATGMGSGVAEAHMDTLSQIVQFDASNLEETLTHELVRYIQQLNFPETLGWHMKFSLKTEDENTMERMEALNSAYQMGASIAESEVFKVLGLSAPTTGQKILSLASQQNAQMQQQMQMQQSMQPQLPMGGDPAQDDFSPEEGVEGDSDTDRDSEENPEGDDGDPMELIKSMMNQYAADMDRDRYMTQLGFKWDEAKHARESDTIGQKRAGEFAPKHQGIFGQSKPKQQTMFGSPAQAPRPVKSAAGDQKKNSKRPHLANAIRSLFAEHVARHEESKQQDEGGIFGKAKSTERDLPTVNPHGKFVKSKTEDEARRDRIFAIANSDRPSSKPEAPAHHHHAHAMLDEVLKHTDDLHANTTDDEHEEAQSPSEPETALAPEPESAPEPAPLTPPRRRMAGQGADAKAVAAPISTTPVKTDVRQEDRTSEPTDPPSVETVPHPSPQADAADNDRIPDDIEWRGGQGGGWYKKQDPDTSGQEPEKKVYRTLAEIKGLPSAPKAAGKSDDGESGYFRQQDKGAGSKTKSIDNGLTPEDRLSHIERLMKGSEDDRSIVDRWARMAVRVKGMQSIHVDDAKSEITDSLGQMIRTWNPEKGELDNWGKDFAIQQVRNMKRKMMEGKVIESTGMSGAEFDSMSQVEEGGEDNSPEYFAHINDQADQVKEAMNMLPENEAWLFNEWFTRPEHIQHKKRDTNGITDEYNQKWGHLHKNPVTANAIGATNGKIDQIHRKLKELLPQQKYSVVREFVMRYFRRELAEMQVERYARRQDRIIGEAAAYTETDPSDAQIKAGNYKKGRFSWNGMTIVIENPRGSTRRGVSDSGEIWKTEMAGHYGYISRTTGTDGDQIDILMGRYPNSEIVFVVHQIDKDGNFDEHKCVLGCTNKQQAKDLYLAHYPKGWKCGEIIPMTIPDFKTWIND